MLKNLNLNQNVIANKVKQSDEIATPCGLAMTESGRSMVEMLGVLAVIGVLSVAGIAGYTTAMNKHRANELLNEASKRAVVVAGQLMNKDTASLSGFSGQKVSGGTFTDETVTRDENNQFTLAITGVDESVCKQMKNAISPAIQKFEPEDCAASATIKLTYNAGLTTEATTQSVIDTSIDNQEDCQYAGKTWCQNAMAEDSSNGVCSNVTDCCKSVSLSPCQTCQSNTGKYVISDKIQGLECDYNNDGNMNDGICYPVQPSATPCGEDSLETFCLNHVQYVSSEQTNCVPVSCSMLGTCCQTYGENGINLLFGQARTALQNEDISALVSIADQANTIQCTACDSTTGETSAVQNGIDCQYADVEYFISQQSFLPGKCENGKCSKVNGFFGYGIWTGSHNLSYNQEIFHECDEPKEIVTDDTFSACKAHCPNRKMTMLDNDGSGICSLNCPSGSFALATSGLQDDDCALCGNPFSNYTPKTEAECSKCENRHIDANGKCVMDYCPTGYFRGAYTCVPCDYQEDTSYDYEVRSSTRSKADCDKCKNDGAHPRTYDRDDNEEWGMCRY